MSAVRVDVKRKMDEENSQELLLKSYYNIQKQAIEDAQREGAFATEEDNKRNKRIIKLLGLARNIQYYGIKLGDNIENVIPADQFDRPNIEKIAYSRKGALEFFRHVKRNRIKEVTQMAIEDKFLVFQHNEV
jgi:hypothetical protein